MKKLLLLSLLVLGSIFQLNSQSDESVEACIDKSRGQICGYPSEGTGGPTIKFGTCQGDETGGPLYCQEY